MNMRSTFNASIDSKLTLTAVQQKLRQISRWMNNPVLSESQAEKLTEIYFDLKQKADQLKQDAWAQTLEGKISVLTDTRQSLLKKLVRLNEEDRVSSPAWQQALADLRNVNGELSHLNARPHH